MGDIPLAYRFTGQRRDEVIRLYDYNARTYDPALGRFIQPDTIVPEPGNPQDLNRYAYARNNPVLYNDPSGHCPWCIAVGIGALIGAGVTYGTQVAANISENGLNVQAFTDVNWKQVGAGAGAGAVGVATFGAGTAVMGTGLIATAASGAVSSAVAGQAAIATENVLSGRKVTEELGDPTDIATDAVIGGTLSSVGYVVERVTIFSLAKISTHNPDSEYVILGGYPNYRNVGAKAGFTYFEMSPKMWSVTNKLGLAEDINIEFMEQQAAQGKTFVVTLAYNRAKGVLGWGLGTERELSWLVARPDYVNTGGRYLWRYRGSFIK